MKDKDAPIAIDAIYRQRLIERRATVSERERASFRFSLLRVAIAIVAVAMGIRGGLEGLHWLFLPFVAFIVAAVFHARLLNARDRALSAVHFYERGLARLAGQWETTGRTAQRFARPDHLYADDLGLFEPRGLFDRLSTARTEGGEETLAEWLLAPAAPDVIRARQEAVRELTPRLDLREAVAVTGELVHARVDAARIRRWAGAPVALDGTATRVAIFILVAMAISALAFWVGTGLWRNVAIALLAVQGLTATWFRNRVHAAAHAVEEPAHDLDTLASLLVILERESFTSPLLQRLQGAVGGEGARPSRQIANLSQRVAMLSSTENILFALPAAMVLWKTQWAFAVEAWRAGPGQRLPQWLDAVGEFEALLAFATFSVEHPDYVFPTFIDGPASLVAAEVAHPLLTSDAVDNDVALGHDGVRLLVVSGSNMSGKSTWLRALGVNVVLAGAGAPVRARAFTLTPLHVGAAISVHDSLADGRSRFFAEIRRLKQIVDLTTATNGAVLFLLDEILAGTNSHDRRAGAQAVLTGLVQRGAIGLATTHDLALGDIVLTLGSGGTNVHFEDRFEHGELTFDYKVRPGVVRTSNAIALMRSIGLDVSDVD